MSEYKCWITDFPERCGDLLKRFEGRAKMLDRDVTLLLAVASACIAIPYDRMRESEDQAKTHPLSDRASDHDREARFDDLLKKPIKKLSFRPDAEEPTFRYGRLASVEGPPDSWPELETDSRMDQSLKFVTLIAHIRNALAHGNIHTRGNPIKEIVLLSQKPKSDPLWYRYLVLTPDDLRAVVMFWIEKLTALGLPPDVVGRIVEDRSEELEGEAA